MSTALLPLMVFLIVKKSDMMERYRWYLLNTIVFCYAYHFILCANQITAFYPSYCFMFDPIVPISRDGSIFSFYVAFFAIINLDLSIVWSLFYRFSQAFPGPFGDFFERGRVIYFIYFVVHVFCYLTVLIPTYLGQVRGEEATRRQFLAENPDLFALADAPLLCFANSENSRRFQLFLAILFSVFFVIGIGMMGVLIRRTHRTKRESVVKSTYRLQMMLVRALSFQMGIGMICLLIPVVVLGFLIYNQAATKMRMACESGF
ncbi:hypothetical protein M3Y99_01334500 [Aphelenchoides fujianensis]|nr:hypothetical protein M3Y99_01334500 [Aphelenchoides fujianensis]